VGVGDAQAAKIIRHINGWVRFYRTAFELMAVKSAPSASIKAPWKTGRLFFLRKEVSIIKGAAILAACLFWNGQSDSEG
jgi:hypothetical protein